MADFAEGMWVKEPTRSAPPFVLMNISVKTDRFIEFLKENENDRGYVNLVVKKSRGGRVYVELNDWKPSEDSDVPMAEQDDDDDDGFPF